MIITPIPVLIWLLSISAMITPNALYTPGVVRPLTRSQICSIKWGKDRRHVTESMKRQVAANYHIPRTSIRPSGQGECCEFDHLIPRELGGADDVRNLWPQPWFDAHIKDKTENDLHVMVCNGIISLKFAQDEMKHWGR